jgi:hypothetical protein
MSTAGALPYGVTLVSCGAAALGVGASVFARGGQLSEMARLWSLGGGTSSPMAVTMLQVGTIMGGAVVGCGLLAVGGHFAKKRALVVVAMAIAVAAAGVQVFSAVQWNALIANSEGDLLTKNAYNFSYSSEQLALLDTSLAVFNKCCFERYINDASIPAEYKKEVQSSILPCPKQKGLNPGEKPVCNPLPDTLSTNDLFKEQATLLCTCYTPSSYDKVYAALDNATCAALGAISVPVGTSLKIPVLNVAVDFALKTTPFSAFLPIEDIAMTGMAAPRDPPSFINNGVLTPMPPTNKTAKEGFNCGLGYAKGVAWIQSLVIAQTAPAAPPIFFGVAAVQCLATALLAAFWAMSGSQTGDEWLETIDPNKAQVAP